MDKAYFDKWNGTADTGDTDNTDNNEVEDANKTEE